NPARPRCNCNSPLFPQLELTQAHVRELGYFRCPETHFARIHDMASFLVYELALAQQWYPNHRCDGVTACDKKTAKKRFTRTPIKKLPGFAVTLCHTAPFCHTGSANRPARS